MKHFLWMLVFVSAVFLLTPAVGGETKKPDTVKWTEHAGLQWSDKSTDAMQWQAGEDYCTAMGGRLPTISELRKLIINCPELESGGSCKVSSEAPVCLEYVCQVPSKTCMCASRNASAATYSALGDATNTALWSSSSDPYGSNNAWHVYFPGLLASANNNKYDKHNVRCVKNITSKTGEAVVVPATAKKDNNNPQPEETAAVKWTTHAGLEWSPRSEEMMNWQAANHYCSSIGGRLPTISELRKIIINCPGSTYGGACKVISEEPVCLDVSCYEDSKCQCDGSADSYSALNDDKNGHLWSSTSLVKYSDAVFVVHFVSGSIYTPNKYHNFQARCVR
ncbi:MAG TPA: DUF1566 domain-containing protein [bacterium]|nr:DUF1566 domain-containing protein [bacterium]